MKKLSEYETDNGLISIRLGSESLKEIYIKWDGCCHITIDDQDEGGTHVCDLRQYIADLQAALDIAEREFPDGYAMGQK